MEKDPYSKYENSDECPIDAKYDKFQNELLSLQSLGDLSLRSTEVSAKDVTDDASKDHCNIFVIKKPRVAEITQYFTQIALTLRWLIQRNKHVYVEREVFEELDHNLQKSIIKITDENKKKINLIITIGGDGTILYAVSLFKSGSVPPIIPFFKGSFGYLCVFEIIEYEKVLSKIFSAPACSQVVLDNRMRISCTLVDKNNVVSETKKHIYSTLECSSDPIKIENIQAINEICIDRGPSQFITNLDCFINGKFLTKVQGDGIMLSTPTGSTAYSLATGGSIVYPSVSAILLTPISPHSLSFRPVIFPDFVYFTIKVPSESRATAWVSIDGHTRFELLHEETIIIKASNFPVRIVTLMETHKIGDWCERLRHSLGWNARVDQKSW